MREKGNGRSSSVSDVFKQARQGKGQKSEARSWRVGVRWGRQSQSGGSGVGKTHVGMGRCEWQQSQKTNKRTFPRFRPIRTDILLSLLSFSSFFDFSLSELFPSAFGLFASPFSLSECKLRRELEPFNNEGKPKLRTELFLCVDPGTELEVDDRFPLSLVGDRFAGALR